MTTAAAVVEALPAPPPDRAASLRLVGWLAGSWLMLLLVGVVMLRMPDALRARNPVSFNRALFTSANVAGGCGFAQEFARPADFTAPVRAVFVLQTLAGGLLSLAGGGVLLARWLGRPYSDGRITATALALLVLGLILGPGGLRGLSAVTCSGVTLGDDPRPASAAFALLLTPLSLIGSLGVVVVCDVVETVRRRVPLPPHSTRVLTLTALVFILGMLALLPAAGTVNRDAFVRASAMVFSARGYGLPVAWAATWPNGVVAVVVAIAAVGAGTAGAAGNMGLGWLVTFDAKRRAAVVNALLAQSMVLSGTLLLLAKFEPSLPALRRLLLAVSASMNLGLSDDPVAIVGPGLIVLAVCIVAGKLLPLIFLTMAVAADPQPAPESVA